jgi:branched-chain amino acid aminotransferase
MELSSLHIAGETHARYLWRNGQIVPWSDATVHVTAAGHASVSAVFEGIKAYWNPRDEELYVFRLREHMQRMVESLKLVRLGTTHSLEAMIEGVLEVLRANEIRRDTYIRPWVFASGIIREQMVPLDAPTEFVIDTWPFASGMLTDRGCRASVSSWTRIGDNSMPPRAKVFSNYHNGRLGILEARIKGFDWPIFLNDRFKVTEGPGACLSLVRGGKVITPAVTGGILESITRATLLAMLPEIGIPVVEREVDRTELYLADEMFYMGTGWEILPVLDVDGTRVGEGRMGPVTQAVDRAYHDLVRGAAPSHADWRAPVWRSATTTAQTSGQARGASARA